MVMLIQWSVELVTRIEIIPRLENHLIDDCFYQDDEIGEMRHTAFMVECGLEEDPPDGPDVDPIPWGDMLLLKIQHEQEQEQNRINEDDSALDAWNQYIKKLKAEEEVRIPKCASSPKLQHVSYKQYAPVA